LVKLLNFLNNWLYKNSSKIVVVGRDMLKLMERKTERLEVSLSFIPNWAELENVEPYPKRENELLNELGIGDKLVLLYAGNMGYPNDIESIVECARQLNRDERFCFIFLGSGVKQKWLEREAANSSNIIVLPPRPRSEQKIFLNACDVAVVSLIKGMWGVSVPSRTYNLLAAGKPILALVEKGSEVDLIIEEEKIGWVVEPGNPRKLLEKILQIYESRNELYEMGIRARKAALEKYSAERAIKKYKALLNDLNFKKE
jgi:glycosyltransferase involved in cell wall biosynthesis